METKLFFAFVLSLSINSVLGFESKATETITQDSIFSEIPYKLARIISLGFTERIYQSNQEHGFRVPVLPPLPDPLDVGDITLVDFPLEGIYTEIYLCNSSMVGLSKLTDDFRVLQEGSGIRLIYELKTETLTTAGLQKTSLSIKAENFNFRSGFGEYQLSLVNGLIKLELLLELNILNQEVHVNATSIDLEFESVTINFADAIYNDESVEWDSVNRDIKLLFENNWPKIKETLEPLLATMLDSMFKDCKTNDIIGLDFSCLGLGNKPEALSTELKTVLRITNADSCPAQASTPTTESASTTTENIQTTSPAPTSPEIDKSSTATENVQTTTLGPVTSPEPSTSSTPSGAESTRFSSSVVFGILMSWVYQSCL